MADANGPVCGIFCQNSVVVARCGALIQAKLPTNCDAHLTEGLLGAELVWRKLRKLLPGRLCILPVLPGSHIFPLAEGGTKAALTVKAGAKGDFLDGNIREFQQEFRRIDPSGDQVLVGSEPCFCRKDPGKMKGT